jgi:hypothetical protein
VAVHPFLFIGSLLRPYSGCGGVTLCGASGCWSGSCFVAVQWPRGWGGGHNCIVIHMRDYVFMILSRGIIRGGTYMSDCSSLYPMVNVAVRFRW